MDGWGDERHGFWGSKGLGSFGKNCVNFWEVNMFSNYLGITRGNVSGGDMKVEGCGLLVFDFLG